MLEHEAFYYQNILASETSKSICLTMKRCREMQWSLTATAVCGTEKITSFPSVVRPRKLLAPHPALRPLPPASWRPAAHWPDERFLLDHSPFTPKYLLLKLSPICSIKKCYWGHSLYTWMSPPEFSCSDGTWRECGGHVGISPEQAHGSSARTMTVPASLFSILGSH